MPGAFFSFHLSYHFAFLSFFTVAFEGPVADEEGHALVWIEHLGKVFSIRLLCSVTRSKLLQKKVLLMLKFNWFCSLDVLALKDASETSWNWSAASLSNLTEERQTFIKMTKKNETKSTWLVDPWPRRRRPTRSRGRGWTPAASTLASDGGGEVEDLRGGQVEAPWRPRALCPYFYYCCYWGFLMLS